MADREREPKEGKLSVEASESLTAGEAAGAQEQQPQTEESECPGCQSLGVLTLPCGHKLCPTCIELSHGEIGPAECTICYGSQLIDSVLHTLLDVLFLDQPRRQRVTRGTEEEINSGEKARGEAGRCCGSEGEELCVQHGEPLNLFCLEEEELFCQECQTDEHQRHQCSSIKEAELVCKRQLRSAVKSLTEQLENITSIRQTWEDTAAHITSQSITTAQVLREEFEKMHQYLRDKEAALMSQLKQEEEEKSAKVEDKISRLSDDIQELTSSISSAEEAMGLEGVPFLKNYKKASERVKCRVEEPGYESEVLLDVAKHQGCLQHRVWENMLKIIQYFPVTLDPNTGSTCLSVSSDLSSVFVCEEQPLPDNPERFVKPQSIMGSEGFSSGRHSWEVEVGENSTWSLGVASETVHRKDRSRTDQNPDLSSDMHCDGLWTVSLSSGEYRPFPGQRSPLTLRRKPRRVRIQLDWERGCLTFSDATDNSLIYRFKKQWSGILRPYFSTTCSKHPLKISSGNVTVTTE